ncbi:MAG: DUF1501 domain-containing protein [Deltaproteobacteria bacterium]|nr:DUF1501 domain-containing protein [Deltaproteobacteria bacterium]
MDRRDFMKAAALTGLALASPLAVRKAKAADDPYNGLFIITVHAGGGWDPTSLCDPKGYEGSVVPDAANTTAMNKSYPAAQIASAGNIKYAPLFDAANNNNGNLTVVVPGRGVTQIPAGVAATARNGQNFFAKHSSRLLVINGIDVQTNDHDGGTRNIWSGKLAEGYPAFAAMFSSAVAKDKPLAYITAGGYDFTAGTVAATRASRTNRLIAIAEPNVRYRNANNNEYYHTPDTYDRIARFQRERTQGAIDAQRLPRWRNALSTLFTVREGNNELLRVMDVLNGNLPGTQTKLSDTLNNGSLQSDFERQVRLGVGAYRAGIAASLSLNSGAGGFDTHQNHDNLQIPSLRTLLWNVDFIVEELNVQQVPLNKVMIIVGSDFGRTPGYNSGNGKDHWSTTSMMFLGGSVPGNRVVGASDERHRMLAVDPGSLAPSTDGVRITPGSINLALRRLTGISEADVAREFPTASLADDLPIFG